MTQKKNPDPGDVIDTIIAKAADQETANGGQVPTINGIALDISKYRRAQDFDEQVGVVPQLNHIRIRKPHRQAFIRVHPAPEYRLITSVLELEETNEFYLLSPIAELVAGDDARPVELRYGITRGGAPFVWPLKLPTPSKKDKDNDWNRTAREAAASAETNWLRVVSDREQGFYVVRIATVAYPPPEWPPWTFAEILGIAFRDKIVDDPEHDVLLKLHGQK
jgi:hypothetical protein